MEEFNGGYSNSNNKGETEKDGDFEEDVWGFVKEQDSSRVTIPRGKSNSSTSNKSMLQKLSSPVNIPEWSNNTSKKKSRRASTTIIHHGSSSSVASADNYGNHIMNGGEVEEDDDYGDGMVPPHEYIARRVARNQIASFSMMEGVGRTLKGRDLSKLRNAILSKTGFLE